MVFDFLTSALLAISPIAAFDDSRPSVATPPYERMLKGQDAMKAADMEARIKELEESDEYAHAAELQSELIALRTRIQGTDHWEAVNALWIGRTLSKVAKMTPDQRVRWRNSMQDQNRAEQLTASGQFANSAPLLQRRLQTCRELLGEDHPATAGSLQNLAGNLKSLGRFAEAQSLGQKALDVRRKQLGEDHPETATGYDAMASIIKAQGQFAQAQPLCQKALDVRRRQLGEEHPDAATSYDNLASILDAQGKFAEAESNFQKALEIRRQKLGEDHPDTAASHEHVIQNRRAQGK